MSGTEVRRGPETEDDDPEHHAVLAAGVGVFGRYGFLGRRRRVTANALHPGGLITNLQLHLDDAQLC